MDGSKGRRKTGGCMYTFEWIHGKSLQVRFINGRVSERSDGWIDGWVGG